MAIWGRRLPAPDELGEGDAVAAPLGSAAEARRRRAAAALKRDLPRFANAGVASPVQAERVEATVAAASPARRFPRRGDPLEARLQEVPQPHVPEPEPPPAAEANVVRPAAPVQRRQFPRRAEPQAVASVEQPAAVAPEEAPSPIVAVPPRRLTPSQRRAAALAGPSPSRLGGMWPRRAAAPVEPVPVQAGPGLLAGLWRGQSRRRAAARLPIEPMAPLAETPVAAQPEPPLPVLPEPPVAEPILDLTAFQAEPTPPPTPPPPSPFPLPTSAGRSRRKRVPDLLGALMAKREAPQPAAAEPEAPPLPPLRSRPALRYPRSAVPAPSLEPEVEASRAQPEAEETSEPDSQWQPPATAFDAAEWAEEPPIAEEPAAVTPEPAMAAPARRRAATFLAPLPQRRTQAEASPAEAGLVGNLRERLGSLVSTLSATLRPVRARSANDEALPQPRPRSFVTEVGARTVALGRELPKRLVSLASRPPRQEAAPKAPRLRPVAGPSAAQATAAEDATLRMPGPNRSAPPVPPGRPSLPLAARLLQVVWPPRPLPARAAPIASAQAAPSRVAPVARAMPRTTEAENSVTNDDTLLPRPASQRPLPPRPPGEPVRGLMPRVLGALQPRGAARVGSAPRIDPEYLRGLLPHRHAAAAQPVPATDPSPPDEAAPTLSLGPWLLRSAISARPESEAQGDATDHPSSGEPPATRDSARRAASRLRGQTPEE